MSQVLKFTCELPNGVHARPASHIETLCNQFTAHIEWLNLRTGRKGNAKSALALIGTDTLHGDECHLMIEGADAEQVLERLSSFIKNEFPHCDAPTSYRELSFNKWFHTVLLLDCSGSSMLMSFPVRAVVVALVLTGLAGC